ncbi:hypothetical protein RIR_jg27528.t1 [Rhizophagus irregularis DAOM 181602=DAOM 197198]|nr:hypothetical protein RIR_jg27528.t1 [Rhizophagus irregularis DAOM 181602=DAOM 197198]
MISENKENVRKSHKLDDDGGGVDDLRYGFIWMKDNEGIGISLLTFNLTRCSPNLSFYQHKFLIVLVVVIGLFIMEVKKITKLCCQRLKSLKYSNISFGEWIFTGR